MNKRIAKKIFRNTDGNYSNRQIRKSVRKYSKKEIWETAVLNFTFRANTAAKAINKFGVAIELINKGDGLIMVDDQNNITIPFPGGEHKLIKEK